MGRRRIYPVKTRKNPIDITTGKPKRGRPSKTWEEKMSYIPRARGRAPKCAENYTDIKINIANKLLEPAREEAERFFNRNFSAYIAHLIMNDVARKYKQINVYKTGIELIREMFPECSEAKIKDICSLIGSRERKHVLESLRDSFQYHRDFYISSKELRSPDEEEFVCKLPKDKYTILKFKMRYYNEDESAAICRLLEPEHTRKYRAYLPQSEKFKTTSFNISRETNNMLVKISNDREWSMTQTINELIKAEYTRVYPQQEETKGE